MRDHRCALPATWRGQQLLAGVIWRCTCGQQRRLNSTYRPETGRRPVFSTIGAAS